MFIKNPEDHPWYKGWEIDDDVLSLSIFEVTFKVLREGEEVTCQGAISSLADYIGFYKVVVEMEETLTKAVKKNRPDCWVSAKGRIKKVEYSDATILPFDQGSLGDFFKMKKSQHSLSLIGVEEIVDEEALREENEREKARREKSARTGNPSVGEVGLGTFADNFFGND